MAVCQVCGCKTDELDFVESRVGNIDKKICSFCDRQLKNIEGENISDAQVKWLNAIVSKEVPERETAVSDELNALANKYLPKVTSAVFQEAPVPQVRFYKAEGKGQKTATEDKDELIAQLANRVDKLEKTIIAMKRAQLIRLVCEISIPVILGIIILIVLLSSGVYGDLVKLLNWI